jgi:small conductance mechanosensitive channel
MRLMRPVVAMVFILMIALLPWSGSNDTVLAQTAADSTARQELLEDVPTDSLGDDASELVSRIKKTLDTGENYILKLAVANAEDSLVLRLQLTKLQERMMADVHELADVLVGLEEKGPREELRTEVEEIFTYSTPGIWRYIVSVRKEIDQARGRRHSTSGAARLVLEDRIAMLTDRLNMAYEIGRTHLEKLEKLGLDTTEAQTTFSILLNERADELSGRVDFALERIDELDALVKDKPGDSDLPVFLVAAHKALETNTTSMELTLDIMDTFELQTKEYRAQLVTATRDLATGLLDKDVALGLAGRALNGTTDWLVESGPGLLVKLLLFFAIIFVARVLARVTRTGVGRALDASKLNISTLFRRMILTSVSNAVMLLGFLIALSQMDVSLGPLLAGLGVVGFIVGFALQDTLANFAAGMMILIYRPYDVGDMIDVSGVFGKVNKMGLVSSTILTIDNQTIVVPNNKIWGDVIKNVTDQDLRRVDMVFGMSYTDDIPKAEQVLAGILKEHDKILDDPEPVIKLHTLGESSVDFIVRPWVAVDDYWDVYWDVTRAVKMRFDEEGISIPFPQRDVHIYEEKVARSQEAEKNDE